ncbi:DNA-binding transcriptional LysR family regulator [Tamaricihabitans halophyticus]|uniref:DNA-binding transcriptional LysR family regulator n=1 Tax=Tamaricihabitans halophyticus TaxID=1262583 RepID=A0A4R2R373_9PSEU|nr:LysR substrate-binding domain-containing protein [Tamaricihabitans halophyticus]TCP57252.1 DNA-binding transcriptional LysR family regulator [Tamaricihabitans halophyticus]
MELRHLRAFVAVAEELSFSRAAARLNISQPPLSQQIKRLEREIGVPLLSRTTRSVSLTAAGEVFLHEVRAALAGLQDATKAAHRAAAGQLGTVRLGFSGPTSYQALLTIARTFREHRPDVRLEIVGPLYGGELVTKLIARETDAGLLRLPVAAPGTRVRELARHPLVAALPAEHPLAGRKSIGLSELRDEVWISYPAGRGSVVNQTVRDACLAEGFAFQRKQEAPDTHTILSLVGAGMGVGMVPNSAEHLEVPNVTLVALDGGPYVPLGLAWRDEPPAPALAALLGLLDEVIERMPADS